MPKLPQRIVYQGQIIRVVNIDQPDGRVFERAERSPGTRNIIYDITKDQILLSREFRQEINEYDYRLPGGKVRDKIEEWEKISTDPKLLSIIADAAKNEAREEVAIESNNIKLFTLSKSGGPTIDWTLYYFITTDFSVLDHQNLEKGENISITWIPVKEAIEICLSGKMKEGRSTAVLLQYFHSIGKI